MTQVEPISPHAWKGILVLLGLFVAGLLFAWLYVVWWEQQYERDEEERFRRAVSICSCDTFELSDGDRPRTWVTRGYVTMTNQSGDHEDYGFYVEIYVGDVEVGQDIVFLGTAFKGDEDTARFSVEYRFDGEVGHAECRTKR